MVFIAQIPGTKHDLKLNILLDLVITGDFHSVIYDPPHHRSTKESRPD